MLEASYYTKLASAKLRCELCPHRCVIPEGRFGACAVRQNVKGKLYTYTYAKPVGLQIDPIEKKPLFHFLPGSTAFSVGTVGCNLGCLFCQNWSTSKAAPGDYPVKEISSELLVALAKAEHCAAIAYTYNEPTVFYEYMLECATKAKEQKIKNVIVSNGFINREPLAKLCNHLQGANIDLKGFDDSFYKKICGGRLQPVLDTLCVLHKKRVWLEITNLIIPGLNDDLDSIKEMCCWIYDTLGADVPLHFSRFHPDYKLTKLHPTPQKTLEGAKKIADQYLNYVYAGNIFPNTMENTCCPHCGQLLVGRAGYTITKNCVLRGACPKCSQKIAGIWE